MSVSHPFYVGARDRLRPDGFLKNLRRAVAGPTKVRGRGGAGATNPPFR